MSNTLLLTIKQNHLSCPQNSRMILGNKCQKTQVFYLQQTGREEIIDLCQSSNYIYKIPHEKYLNRIRISLLSLKLQIWRLLRARSSLTFRQIIECSFTLKFVLNMIITFSQKYLCRCLFFKNFVGWKSADMLKRDSSTGAFLSILQNFLRTPISQTSADRCFWI